MHLPFVLAMLYNGQYKLFFFNSTPTDLSCMSILNWWDKFGIYVTIGRVHATVGRVHATTCRLHATIG
jgi:hypothetical protein